MTTSDPLPEVPPRTEPAAGGTESQALFARNASVLLLAQVLSTVMAVALNAALGRTLGPAEYGVFVVTSSMAGFAYVVLEWGQTQYVVREIAQQPQREGVLLGTSAFVRVVGAGVMAVATLATAWLLGYDGRTRWLAVAYVGAMLPYFLAQAASLVFRARERMEYDALSAIVDRAATLTGTVLALAIGIGVAGAAAGVVVGGSAALLVAVIVLRRLGAGRLSLSLPEASAMLTGGFAIMVANVESSTQPYLDAIILSKLTPPEVVGWYGAARTFTGTLVAPAIVLSVAAYPRLARAARDPLRLRQELRAVMRPLFALAALASAGTFLFARQAVNLVYGRRGFAPAAVVLQVLAVSLLLFFADNVLAVAVVAVGRAAPLAVAKLVNIAACAGLALLLVPRFQASRHNGGLGLALATGLAETIMCGAALLILPRGSLDRSLLHDLVRAVAAGAGTLILFAMLPELPLFVGMALCILAFGGLAIAVRLVQPSEIRAVGRAILRRAPAAA